jgi:2,3-bisphosphoglycerate-independent phosphoglycerate mutase
MNESFDDYQIRVSKCIDLCEYEKISIAEIRETLLRDRIAFGIRVAEVMKRILKQDPTKLKLNDVIQTCKISEITEERFSAIKDETKEINKMKFKSSTDQKVFLKCKFCGKHHPFTKGNCSAFNHVCSECKKKGHHEICCYKKNIKIINTKKIQRLLRKWLKINHRKMKREQLVVNILLFIAFLIILTMEETFRLNWI